MRHKIVMVMLSVALIASLVLAGCVEPAAPPGEPDGEPTPAPEQEVYTLKFQHWHPSGTSLYEWETGPDGFAASVERASGGRIHIDIYPCGTIAGPMECHTAAAEGLVDFCGGCGAYRSGLEPEFSLFESPPFTLRYAEDIDLVYYSMGLEEIAERKYAEYGCKFLGPTHESPRGIFSKKPIYGIDDFKGLKIRAVGTYVETYTMAGASGMTTPGSEIYEALERGICEACTWGGEGAMSELGLQEVCDYIVVPWVNGGPAGDFLIGMDKFDSLPADLQEVILQCARVRAVNMGNLYRYDNLTKRKELVESGQMELCELPPEEIAKLSALAMDLMDDYSANSELGAEICGIYREFMRLRGY